LELSAQRHDAYPAGVWLAAALLAVPTAEAAGSYDVCREPAPESSFHAGYGLYEDVRLAGGDLGRENWAADLVFRSGDDWLIGGSYRGTLLDESAVDFRTNGYLHDFYFQLHRLRTGDERVRWAVAPALSASSNVTKDPGQYDGEAWQLLLAAVWEWPANDTLAYRAGLCADHRFGRYLTYPVVSVAWRPHPDWLVEAGFPDTTVSFRPGTKFHGALSVYPNGNEWYVKDQSLEYASMFEYRAWAADLSFTWRATPAIALTLVGGVDFDAEYRGELGDGTRPTLDAGTAGRAGIEFTWTF